MLLSDLELNQYCNKVEQIVGKQTLTISQLSCDDTNKYYSKLNSIYRKFHSELGAMHFPIKFSEEEKHKEKLLYQAKSVEQLLDKSVSGLRILELGCGMGYNSIYLAQKLPNVNFTAVDITTSNIEFAKKKGDRLKNLTFQVADFDNIEAAFGKFDIIFGVETLCYSKDLHLLLHRLVDFLNTNGKIVIFDAFVNNRQQNLSEVETKAYNMLLWGWSLKAFSCFAIFDKVEASTKLKITKKNELTSNIMSNNLAYQNGSVRAIRYTPFLKLLFKIKLLPLSYLQHLTAGLFSHYFMKIGHLKYMQIVLVRTP